MHQATDRDADGQRQLFAELGATLQIEANDAGQSDKVVVVGGTVSLTGAILQVLAAPGTYAASTAYLIIDNQGDAPVTGTFGEITSNFAFLTPTVIYDGGVGNNDVVLTLVNNDAPGPNPDPSPTINFCKAAATANQCSVANALSNLGPSNPLYDAILVQSVAGAQQAFNALSGEVHSTVSSTLANDSHYVRDILLEPPGAGVLCARQRRHAGCRDWVPADRRRRPVSTAHR